MKKRSLGQTKKENTYELYRFCTKLGHLCIGGFSKLLNHFIKNVQPSEIITYANRDWSFLQNVYQKNGFSFISLKITIFHIFYLIYKL